MKKLLFLAAFLFALSMAGIHNAAAQNRAITSLAKKYADREGFSTTVVKGDISSGFAGSLDVEGVDISNIIRDISSIVVIRSESPDANFAREVERAVSEGYSTMLSASSEGEKVRFLLSDSRSEAGNEFVIVILGPETNLLVSIVGDYKLGKMSRVTE
jgi:hypothetical protein